MDETEELDEESHDEADKREEPMLKKSQKT
jgi:hypothetical protein